MFLLYTSIVLFREGVSNGDRFADGLSAPSADNQTKEKIMPQSAAVLPHFGSPAARRLTTRDIAGVVLFDTPEDAWFWHIAWRKALNDGGGGRWRFAPARVPRPCEPVEVGVVLRRLHSRRLIFREHLAVLRRYGMRGRAPVADSPRGCRELALWLEAMNCLGVALQSKGIIDWMWRPVSAPERARMLSVPTGRIRSWRAADAVPRRGAFGAELGEKAGVVAG